jgi:hypothetical protein
MMMMIILFVGPPQEPSATFPNQIDNDRRNRRLVTFLGSQVLSLVFLDEFTKGSITRPRICGAATA